MAIRSFTELEMRQQTLSWQRCGLGYDIANP
jgi:hypothetical protein